MKEIFGLFLILLGIVLGIFVGGYLCLFGGIVSIVLGIKAGLVASTIAWGVVRVVFAGIAGVLSAIILIIPGLAMLNPNKKRKLT